MVVSGGERMNLTKEEARKIAKEGSKIARKWGLPSSKKSAKSKIK